MPKHGFMTPKAIANRIKSKGLQKLKWFCQMCEKQCRDENGFKCHKMAESHQRKMKLFIDAPHRFMNDFSRDFDKGFVQILRLKGGRRVKANEVYQDYIANREHVHMNATVWSTLTGYVLYLGKTGKATVERAENDGTERATWYIQYIDRDPEVIAKQQQIEKMQKMEQRERKMESQQIHHIIAQNQKLNKLHGNEYAPSTLEKKASDEKLSFGFKPKSALQNDENEEDDEDSIDAEQPAMMDPTAPDDDGVVDHDHDGDNMTAVSTATTTSTKKRKLNNIEALIAENEAKKRRKLNDASHRNHRIEDSKQSDVPLSSSSSIWVCKHIVVKITHGVYMDKKAEVLDVLQDGHRIKAVVRLLKCADDIEIKIKQQYLETVVPSFGRKVKILNGRYKGCVGVLQDINDTKYTGEIALNLPRDKQSRHKQKIVSTPYEDFSKLVHVR